MNKGLRWLVILLAAAFAVLATYKLARAAGAPVCADAPPAARSAEPPCHRD